MLFSFNHEQLPLREFIWIHDLFAESRYKLFLREFIKLSDMLEYTSRQHSWHHGLCCFPCVQNLASGNSSEPLI